MKICKYDKLKIAMCFCKRCTIYCLHHPDNDQFRKNKKYIRSEEK